MKKIIKNTFAIISISCISLLALGIFIANHMGIFHQTHVHSSFAIMSAEGLMENSSLVVRGRVVRSSRPFTVESRCGGQTVFIDYYIEPYEILRGETPSSEIVVRIEGGRTREMNLINDSNSNFRVGGEYLLFLASPSGRDVFDTPGDYFYIFGGPQGVLVKNERLSRSLIASDDAVFIQESASDEFVLSALRENIEIINEEISPPDACDINERIRNNIITSIENGVWDLTEEQLYYELNPPLFSARIIGR